VDVWSLGVVLFAMVAGFLPFHSSAGNKQELCQRIMAGTYTAPEAMSPALKDLLSRMLTTDPDARIKFDQVWSHAWVRNQPRWVRPVPSVYCVRLDPSSGTVLADAAVLADLEAAGYPRAAVLKYLGAGECNYITASYYLAAEQRAEAAAATGGSSSPAALAAAAYHHSSAIASPASHRPGPPASPGGARPATAAAGATRAAAPPRPLGGAALGPRRRGPRAAPPRGRRSNRPSRRGSGGAQERAARRTAVQTRESTDLAACART